MSDDETDMNTALRARQEITFTVACGRGMICTGGERGHATGEIRGAVPAFG